MENIIELTNQFIISENICSLPVDLKHIKAMLEKHNFTVLSYFQAADILKLLNLTTYAQDKYAFTVIMEDIRLVLYRDNLSVADKLFCLAHELGHIVLDHLAYGTVAKNGTRSYTSIQEYEADTFAYQLLAPLSVLKRCSASYSEISRVTLLTGFYAENIFARMSSCYVGLSDQILFEKFYDFINVMRLSMLTGSRLKPKGQ